MGSLKFNVGDLVIIRAEDAYEGTFDGEIGFVTSIPYKTFSYVMLFCLPNEEVLFKTSEIFVYNPLDDETITL